MVYKIFVESFLNEAQLFAAEDMRKVLSVKKRLDISVCDTADNEDGDVLIYMGSSLSEKICGKYGFDFLKVTHPDGYRLFIKTVNDKKIVLIYGSNNRGIYYGSAAYMEHHGIRFISPGDEGTHYAKELDLSETDSFDLYDEPMFKTREGFSSFINDNRIDFFMWLVHNKLNTVHLKEISDPELFNKLSLDISGGGHSIWYEYMDINQKYPYKHKIAGGEGEDDPYEVSPYFNSSNIVNGTLTYGQAHPEWYAEINGKRTLKRDYEAYKSRGYATGDFICTSNEDATDEFIKLFLNSLISGENKHLNKVVFYALDNGNWCECEKCKEQGNYSTRMLLLAYKLDRAIKKATEEGKIKRKILITIPAYHETLPPPDKPLPDDFDYETVSVIYYVIERCYLHNINDLKCTETNKALYDNLLEWTNGYYKGEITIGEYYNVSSFAAMPFVFPKRIINDIPFYYSTGARHMHYMHMTAGHWGVSALNNYLFGKLMWNINYDKEKLLDEYFKAKYKEHSLKMREIYEMLEKCSENSKYIKHYQYINGVRRWLFAELKNKQKNLFDFKHIKFDSEDDDPQNGISFCGTVKLYEHCFEEFKEYIKGKDLSVFKEDHEQLEYGFNMLKYMYYCTLEVSKRASFKTSEKINFYKERLREETVSLSGYDKGPMFKNGLTATFMLEG